MLGAYVIGSPLLSVCQLMIQLFLRGGCSLSVIAFIAFIAFIASDDSDYQFLSRAWVCQSNSLE